MVPTYDALPSPLISRSWMLSRSYMMASPAVGPVVGATKLDVPVAAGVEPASVLAGRVARGHRRGGAAGEVERHAAGRVESRCPGEVPLTGDDVDPWLQRARSVGEVVRAVEARTVGRRRSRRGRSSSAARRRRSPGRSWPAGPGSAPARSTGRGCSRRAARSPSPRRRCPPSVETRPLFWMLTSPLIEMSPPEM